MNNSLIDNGISMILIAVLVLIVGMIKPKWILLWMDQPGRMPIAMIAMVIFMIGAILFGEGNKQKQAQAAGQQAEQVQAQNPKADVPQTAVPPAPASRP